MEKARLEQANLDKKLGDIRVQSQELRNQIGEWNLKLSAAYSHREQVAREEAVLNERMRSLETQVSNVDVEIMRLQEEINFYREQCDNAITQIELLEKAESETKVNLKEATQHLDERRKQAEIAENELQEARQALSSLNTHQSILRTQLDEQQRSVVRREMKLVEITAALQQADQELAGNQASLAAAVERQQNDDRLLQDADGAVQANREMVSRLEKLQRERLESVNAAQAKLTQLQTQLHVLRQAEDDLSGYADGARLLLQALNNARIPGARGALSNYIEVPDDYEEAVASALGEYLGAVIVEGWDGVEKALEILDEGDVRGALLMLEALSPPKPLMIDITKSPVESGAIIGVASELVKAHGDLRPIVDLLLGQVVIVRDRMTARRLLANGKWSSMPLLRIVTTKGEVFHSTGPVLSASRGKGILSRPKQRKALESGIAKANQDLIEMQATAFEVNEKLSMAIENEKLLSNVYQKALCRAEGSDS